MLKFLDFTLGGATDDSFHDFFHQIQSDFLTFFSQILKFVKTTVVRSAYATLSQLTWWSLAESLKKFDEKSASGWLDRWAEKCLEMRSTRLTKKVAKM